MSVIGWSSVDGKPSAARLREQNVLHVCVYDAQPGECDRNSPYPLVSCAIMQGGRRQPRTLRSFSYLTQRQQSTGAKVEPVGRHPANLLTSSNRKALAHSVFHNSVWASTPGRSNNFDIFLTCTSLQRLLALVTSASWYHLKLVGNHT